MVRPNSGSEVSVKPLSRKHGGMAVDPLSLAVSIFLSTSGSPMMTPGKFITSAKPMAQGSLNRGLRWEAGR